jgi:altronate dehydratase
MTAAPLRATIRLHPDDPVVVAARPLSPGEVLADPPLTVRSEVPAGHKIAVRRIAAGAEVRKFGQIIGVATADIEPGEHVHAHNLVFMDTPGYDPVSATGMVAGGATVMCFTTGRGSVFGCKPTPSIKLATNSDTYRRMPDDMDVDCGVILDGEATVEEVGRDLYGLVVEVASGRRTLSEELGFGAEEFAPWHVGAVM